MSRVEALDKESNGVLGVAAIDLQTGAIVQYNGQVVFPQASSIKIPILAEVFRQSEAGTINLRSTVQLAPGDAVGGSGDLQAALKRGHVTLTVRDLMEKMIVDSDNTATNRLIAMVSLEAVNQFLSDAGLKNTKLQRRMMDRQAAVENRENVSTPLEMARLAQLIYEGKCVSASASKEMIEILKRVKADFRAAIPLSTAVASKPGDLDGVHAETGIVFLSNRPFVLSVMSTYLDENSNPVPAIVRLIYKHFGKLANSNRYGHKLQ
jgi:beta-lactamase class A